MEQKNEIQIVIFAIGGNNYGIDIFQIQEIILPPKNITKIPDLPSYVIGVSNFRGKAVSIIDMCKRLGLPEQIITPNTRIIMIQLKNKTIGIMVENVFEVIKLNCSKIDDSQDILGGISAKYLMGVGHIDDKLILTLSIDKLFSDKELFEIE